MVNEKIRTLNYYYWFFFYIKINVLATSVRRQLNRNEFRK